MDLCQVVVFTAIKTTDLLAVIGQFEFRWNAENVICRAVMHFGPLLVRMFPIEASHTCLRQFVKTEITGCSLDMQHKNIGAGEMPTLVQMAQNKNCQIHYCHCH